MPNENKRFYWLKLKKDFFKRHDIRIIEAMPNGKDYILFYLKLLVESVDHEGNLRFSETIPYNETMLSVITNTNVDIVKSAMQVFTELKMIEVLDDSTIYMNEVNKLIGSETSVAERVRKCRENKKMLSFNEDVTLCNINVTKCNTEKEIEKDIELDKDIDIEKEKEYYYEGKEKKGETPFSQNLVLKLFQNQYISKLEDYDEYINSIEEFKDKYNEKDIEDKMDEFLNQKESFYATANERLSYFKSTMTKLLNNESVEDEQDSLPF